MLSNNEICLFCLFSFTLRLHRPAERRKDLVLCFQLLKICLLAMQNTMLGDLGLETSLNVCCCLVLSFGLSVAWLRFSDFSLEFAI